MRTTIGIVILTLAVVASAEERLSIFISDPTYTHGYVSTFQTVDGTGVPENHKRTELTGGVGIAYSHAWSSRWSTEASMAFERHHMQATQFLPVVVNGKISVVPVTAPERVDTFPFDLMMHYSFANSSRWTPRIGAGVRHVSSPDVTVPATIIAGQPIILEHPSSRLSAQLEAGALLRLTKNFGLDFNVKRLVRSDAVPFDPLTRGAAGVSWKW